MKISTENLPAVALLLDDSRGIYIPQHFCKHFRLEDWSLSENDSDVTACLEGPDNEWYWDAWHTVMEKAFYRPSGHRLYQDGDLFALNYDEMTNKERRNFGLDEIDEEEPSCQI